MLDCFEIITTSGVVLWSRVNHPTGPSIVNSLISDVFIEEKYPADQLAQRIPAHRYDKYTLKYTLAKDLGLIFVAVYQSFLHLTWVEKLLEHIEKIFVGLYKEQLGKPDAAIRKYDFDRYFDQQIRDLEDKTPNATASELQRAALDDKKEVLENGDTGGPPPPPYPGQHKAQPQAASFLGDSNQSTPVQTPESSRPTTPVAGHLLAAKQGPGGRASRRARKANTGSAPASGDERRIKNTKPEGKQMRKWNADGTADVHADVKLDYSTPNAPGSTMSDGLQSPPPEAVASETFGSRTQKGQFVLKDLDDEVNSLLGSSKSSSESSSTGVVGSSLGAISGYFRNFVGGKTLTKQDLDKPLKEMENHLIKKNVARDAAVRLCQGVESELIGKKTGSFESIDSALRAATETSLRKILTPTSSIDLLREVESVVHPTSTRATPRPYVISVVGVNGVGKSTNLSKLAFFLLQNNYRLLIAACDTFRSGAVEQLNVHVRNLKELSARENLGAVDLYQRGYDRDAANVAKEAVAYAAQNKFDVVLIDTAGRRHNDKQLMSSLEKFAKLAQPDKIFMVGEALVGNDSVNQALNFNSAFGTGRRLDGFIISKCDTVGDMVGTLVSMVHATSIPVCFLGVGQHYGDLRTLSVPWAVGLLMAS
ncbi:MAG: hypothetical protein Q9227_008203 [Pyrenula ochraceoflavens]